MEKTCKRLAALALAACAAAGCYPERMTAKYSEIPVYGTNDENLAVLERSGGDEAAQQAQREELRRLNQETVLTYTISAGDRIQVRVYGHDDLTIDTRVSPDGHIGMAFLGQVKLGGCSISEASEKIRKGLSRYIKNPMVGVNVFEIASETVTVSGACATPGIYNISNRSRLADVYAMAGGSAVRLFDGVAVDVAELSRSFIVRDGRILPVDFALAIKKGDKDHNIKLKRDDYIFIEQRMESSITICGDVARPHRRLFEDGVGLIEILTYAGWMKETHWSHVILIRNSLSNPEMYKIDVDAILNGKGRNITMKPNDIVYVPKDSISEYNVFVHKLMPTAQLVSLLTSRVTTISNN